MAGAGFARKTGAGAGENDRGAEGGEKARGATGAGVNGAGENDRGAICAGDGEYTGAGATGRGMTGAGDPENVRGDDGNDGDEGRGNWISLGAAGRGEGIGGSGPAADGDDGRGSIGWIVEGRLLKESCVEGRVMGRGCTGVGLVPVKGCVPASDRDGRGFDAGVARCEKARARASCDARAEGTADAGMCASLMVGP